MVSSRSKSNGQVPSSSSSQTPGENTTTQTQRAHFLMAGFILAEGPTLENLRNLMVNATYGGDGARQYIKDQPINPISGLFLTLFPSPTGGLNPITNAPSNLGRYTTTETISALFDYMDYVRGAEGENAKKEQALKEAVHGSFDGVPDRNLIRQNVNTLLKNLQDAVAMESTAPGLFPQYFPERNKNPL